MRVAIGSDHAGLRLKADLCEVISAAGYDVIDLGAREELSSDYPDYAARVGQAVTDGRAQLGVLICGTGAGMAIAANKLPGVRASAVSEPVTARLTRSHNDANVVCLGERIVGPELAAEIVLTFLATPFSQDERHIRRNEKVSRLETLCQRR